MYTYTVKLYIREGPDTFVLELVVRHREEVFMEGPIEPNMGPSLADVLLCTCRVFRGKFWPESISSFSTAFSHKGNLASSGQHRVENKTR
jgi:hypothetical protein